MNRKIFIYLVFFVVCAVAVIDIIYFQALLDASQGGQQGVWAPNRVDVLGYQIEIGHVAIALTYWLMLFPILFLYYKQTKNPRRTFQLAAFALVLQVFLVEDVLFYFFQGQNPASVQYTWLYGWNTVLGDNIPGTLVLGIALIGTLLAYYLIKKKRGLSF